MKSNEFPDVSQHVLFLFFSLTHHFLSLSLSAAYWRFWLCVTVVYELFLIFILFQVGAPVDDNDAVDYHTHCSLPLAFFIRPFLVTWSLRGRQQDSQIKLTLDLVQTKASSHKQKHHVLEHLKASLNQEETLAKM